jgi:hypothetical protein
MKSLCYAASLTILCSLLLGCPEVAPGSKTYAPAHGSYEAGLFPQARRDVFPSDVRANPQGNRGQILLWSGIVKESLIEGALSVTMYEHHYWDWVEDYGSQQEIAFLSPRGEGSFMCKRQLSAFSKDPGASLSNPGEMAIVYGTVDGVKPDGTVVLDCAPLIKTLPAGTFATDIWDYGRKYVLSGDKADLKILRRPGA